MGLLLGESVFSLILMVFEVKKKCFKKENLKKLITCLKQAVCCNTAKKQESATTPEDIEHKPGLNSSAYDIPKHY